MSDTSTTRELALTAAKALSAAENAASPAHLEKILGPAFDAFDAFMAQGGNAEEFFEAMYETGAAYGSRDTVVSYMEDLPDMLKAAAPHMLAAGVSQPTVNRWIKFADDFGTLFEGFG